MGEELDEDDVPPQEEEEDLDLDDVEEDEDEQPARPKRARKAPERTEDDDFGKPKETAAERLRLFFEERRRDVSYRHRTEEEKKEDAEKFSDANFERYLDFIKVIEERFVRAEPTIISIAFVDLIKAYLTRASLADICGVASRLFGDEIDILNEFAAIVGTTMEQVEAMRRAEKPKRSVGRPPKAVKVEKKRKLVVPAAKAPPKKKKKKSEDVVWHTDGDDQVGCYFLHQGEKMLEKLARVDAWAVESGLEAAKVLYRGTIILGPKQGTLVEAAELPFVNEDLASVLKHCDNFDPEDMNKKFKGLNLPMVITAAKKIKLFTKLSSEEWTAQFNNVVWAQDKATEPPWPAEILDPRNLDDDALIDRAAALVGKKHIVRFLGLPHDKSLGFVVPKRLSPFTSSEEHVGEVNSIKRLASRHAFTTACQDADRRIGRAPKNGRVPVAGDLVNVRYDGDPTTYLCKIQKNPVDGSLMVFCDQFPPEDQAGIPFCPNEDEWTFPDGDDDPDATDDDEPPPGVTTGAVAAADDDDHHLDEEDDDEDLLLEEEVVEDDDDDADIEEDDDEEDDEHIIEDFEEPPHD